MKEVLTVILAVATLVYALIRIRQERKWFAEDEAMMKGWLDNRDVRLASLKVDLGKMTSTATRNISTSLLKTKEIKKLKCQLANRKGQITKMKRKIEMMEGCAE